MAVVLSRVSQLRVKHLAMLNLIQQAGSLRKAALDMHLTQPAVTGMLKELEGAFGAKLVDRDRNGARLTSAGLVIRDRLLIVLNELQAADEEQWLAGGGGYLRVGVLPVAMLDLVPAAVARIRQSDEQIALKFVEGSIEQIVSGVLRNELDCAIGRMDGFPPAQKERDALFSEQLLQVPLGVACSPRHILARRRKIPMAELAREEWVLLPKDSQTRISFDQAFIQEGISPPQAAVESLSFFSNFHMVSRSNLLTIAPRVAIARYRSMAIVDELRSGWKLSLSPLLFICQQAKLGSSTLERFRVILANAARTSSTHE